MIKGVDMYLRLLIALITAICLQSCAGGPGKPGEATLEQPSATPNMDYIYRGPPPAVARALR